MTSATHFHAVLFDLDGVLTSTSALHAACWNQTFNGVRDFLRTRGIDAPAGGLGSPPEELSVYAIAERKQALVEQALARQGVEAFPGSVRWVEQLRAAGLRTSVVSSSKNAAAVLSAAGIAGLFDDVVDGGLVERLGLRGKPAPDRLLVSAARLGVEPRHAIVVEDALAGVEAGRAGGFGLVVGVARGAAPAELRAAGADIVVGDLAEMVR